MNESVYKQKGYTDRLDYLKSLADRFHVTVHTVVNVAELLGPQEDFDGLLNELENVPEGM